MATQINLTTGTSSTTVNLALGGRGPAGADGSASVTQSSITAAITNKSTFAADNDLQTEIEVKSANFTAAIDGMYHAVATLTATDPATPVEGKGFAVFIRNGTATIGGTAYANAGSIVRRVWHSGSYTNYLYRDATAYAAAIHTHSYSGGDITGLPLIRVAPSGATAGSLASNVDGTGQATRNALGQGAVDLQSFRTASNQVASGVGSFAAGYNNRASGAGSVAIGTENIASATASFACGGGTTASGSYSFAGGLSSNATGAYSFAFGNRAKAVHLGSMVLSDEQDADVSSTLTSQFTARYSSGYRFLGGGAVFSGAVSGSNLSGTNTGNETAATIATALNAGTEDVTAADTDRIAVISPAGGWMTLATLWTWISNFTGTLTNKTLTNPTVNNYTEGVVAIGNSGSSQTLALTSGTFQTMTMTANCTVTMPTATAGKSFVLRVSTGSGSFVPTFTGVKWPDNTAPTFSSTASRYYFVTFQADGTAWSGQVSGVYTP